MNIDIENYDVAVIGAGTGGLVAAFACDGLGAKTALIERAKLGGESLWTGSVPSKALIKSAKVFEMVSRAEEFGVHIEQPRVIWRAVQLRIAAVRDEIKALERAELERSKIDYLSGEAKFLDANTLELVTKSGVRHIGAKKFIIATGTKTHIPTLPGLEDVDYLTHKTIYDVPALPRSLTILGGGPRACEFAQAFVRFGTKVNLLHDGPNLLPQEDSDLSEACRKMLQNEGVQVFLDARVTRAANSGERIRVEFMVDGEARSVEAGKLLLALGKVPYDSLSLSAAGVAMDEHGIITDEHLQTSARHIFACGDITGKYLFAHVAEYQAKIAAQNALLPVKAKVDYRVVPWTTFTDPEIAHMGLTEDEAREAHGEAKVYRAPFDHLDRAIIEGETSGFLKFVTTGSGRIVGAHIIGPQAGELIHTFVPAVRDGVLIQELAETLHVYPTLAEIGRRAGNQFYRDTLDAKPVRWLLKRLIKSAE